METDLAQQSIKDMQVYGNFEIQPCDDNFDNRRDLIKLDATSSASKQIGALFSQVPALASTGVMANAYCVKFPEGVAGTLMQYKTGGVGSSIMGEKGIVDHAAFYQMTAQSVVLGAFTAMSIVSGQYFLAKINSEMKMMNAGIEKILEFLYGDKKAELMSELIFVRNAYRDFPYISQCCEQKIATIGSLQDARIIAMKDIEFYISDLDTTVKSKKGDYAERAFQIKDSLDLAMQLYTVGTLLEVYYSENFDKNYISNVEKETTTYLAKCESRVLNSFSELNGGLRKANDEHKPLIADIITELTRGEDSELRKIVKMSLGSATKNSEYYINKSGEVYIKQ